MRKVQERTRLNLLSARLEGRTYRPSLSPTPAASRPTVLPALRKEMVYAAKEAEAPSRAALVERKKKGVNHLKCKLRERKN